eukprot:4052139-Pyramimonas_sp.AAC.1
MVVVVENQPVRKGSGARCILGQARQPLREAAQLARATGRTPSPRLRVAQRKWLKAQGFGAGVSRTGA